LVFVVTNYLKPLPAAVQKRVRLPLLRPETQA
jgi:hypothetical protein